MKSKKVYWVLLFICLLPTIYLLFSGKFFSTLKQSSGVNQEAELSNQLIKTLTAHKTSGSDIKFYTDTQETWNTASKAVEKAISLLPQKVKEGFVEKRWKVGIVDQPTEKQQELLNELVKIGGEDTGIGYFRGITVPSSKFLLVYLKNEDNSYNPETFEHVLLHEFGHYFECEHMTEEEKQTWQEKYGKIGTVERWVALDYHEGLAEMFADILIDDRARYSDNEAPAYDYIRGRIYSIRY